VRTVGKKKRVQRESRAQCGKKEMSARGIERSRGSVCVLFSTVLIVVHGCARKSCTLFFFPVVRAHHRPQRERQPNWWFSFALSPAACLPACLTLKSRTLSILRPRLQNREETSVCRWASRSRSSSSPSSARTGSQGQRMFSIGVSVFISHGRSPQTHTLTHFAIYQSERHKERERERHSQTERQRQRTEGRETN